MNERREDTEALEATSRVGPPRGTPLLVLTLGILAVSTASVFIRQAQTEAPSLVIAAYRLSLATLVLAPVTLLHYRRDLLSMTLHQWALAVGSGGFLAVHFATWITSLEYTTVASSVVLVSTSPLWVALAGRLFLGEHLSAWTAVGLLAAMAGGTIIGLADARDHAARDALLGNTLAIVGALAVAGYWLAGRHLRAHIPVIPYVAVVYGTAAVLLLAAVLATGLPLSGYSPAVYAWFVGLALVPQLLGHSSFNWALAHLPATFVSVTTLGEPIGSAALAWWLLGEAPTMLKACGAALILAGIAVTLRGQRSSGEETDAARREGLD